MVELILKQQRPPGLGPGARRTSFLHPELDGGGGGEQGGDSGLGQQPLAVGRHLLVHLLVYLYIY